MNNKENKNGIEENLDETVKAVSMWKIEKSSVYYDPVIDTLGYSSSRSAREILTELGIDLETNQEKSKRKLFKRKGE